MKRYCWRFQSESEHQMAMLEAVELENQRIQLQINVAVHYHNRQSMSLPFGSSAQRIHRFPRPAVRVSMPHRHHNHYQHPVMKSASDSNWTPSPGQSPWTTISDSVSSQHSVPEIVDEVIASDLSPTMTTNTPRSDSAMSNPYRFAAAQLAYSPTRAHSVVSSGWHYATTSMSVHSPGCSG